MVGNFKILMNAKHMPNTNHFENEGPNYGLNGIMALTEGLRQ